jgi:hypothetical protein
VQRRQRHLRGGDRPEVVALDLVGVVGELRQVTGGRHRVGAHDGGRAHLGVGVSVAVEAELHEGPQEAGPPPRVHREHRPGDLRGPLGVEQAELLADVPVGHPLVVAERARVVALGAEHDVVGLAGAVGGVDRGQVGRAQQQVLHLRGQRAGLPVEHLLLVAERAALGHEGLSAVGVTRAAQPPDVLGDRLDARPDLIALRAHGPLAGVEGEELVDHRRHLRAAPGQPGARGVGIGTESLEVQHARRG